MEMYICLSVYHMMLTKDRKPWCTHPYTADERRQCAGGADGAAAAAASEVATAAAAAALVLLSRALVETNIISVILNFPIEAS